jgi:hypothetical protein
MLAADNRHRSVVSTSTAGPVEVPTSTAKASRAAARVIVVRGRQSVGLARVYRVSDSQCLCGIGTWSNDASAALGHPKPSMKSVTYLAKHERPEIALFCALARLADDLTLTPERVGQARLGDARKKAAGAADV